MSAAEKLEVRLYSIVMAATVLSVSKSTVRRLIASGALKAVRVGSSRLVPAEALEQFAEQLMSNGAAA